MIVKFSTDPKLNRTTVYCQYTYPLSPYREMYLVAVIDWFSRYVLSWKLSNTLNGAFCIDALHEALQHGKPDIFNSD